MFAAQIPKTTEKIMNFSKGKYISSKCSLYMSNAFVTTLPNVSTQNFEKLFARTPERMKKR